MVIKHNLSSQKEIGIIIFLAIVIFLPFVNKPFHIDDTTHIYCARQIIKTPLLNYTETVNWHGIPQGLWLLSDSPIISYYIAFVIKIFGENELWLHIFFLPFSILAIISMYFLSRRFTDYPLLSTLLLFSTSAFVVSATNIMPDIASLALYLATLCLFMHGLEKDSKWLLIISGFVAGLTCLTKYTGLTLIPLLFFYSLLKRKILKGALALLICFILLGIWCLHNLVFFKKIHFLEVIFWFRPAFFPIFLNLFATLNYIGATTIHPFLFILLIRAKKDILTLFFIAWLVFLILFYFGVEYALPRIVLTVFFVSTAIFLLQRCITILRDKIIRHQNAVFLSIWIAVISVYNIFLRSWATAPRYTLILAPALILLFLKTIFTVIDKHRMTFNISIIKLGIILNFIFSLSVAYADYIYADTCRNFAQTYAASLKEKSKKVWFRGHWGFQYYMERQGFGYLGLDDMPGKGDIIIMPAICDHEPFYQGMKDKLRLIRTIKYESRYPVRTMSLKDRINFYSYSLGWLPYGVSGEPLEAFQIWQAQ